MGYSELALEAQDPHAFEPFAQEDPANVGTGLGAFHREKPGRGEGRQGAESVKGANTTFTVHLHFEETDQLPVADAHMADATQSGNVRRPVRQEGAYLRK